MAATYNDSTIRMIVEDAASLNGALKAFLEPRTAKLATIEERIKAFPFECRLIDRLWRDKQAQKASHQRIIEPWMCCPKASHGTRQRATARF